MKYTGIISQTLQDIDLVLTIENNIRGCISSVMGDRYVKSDENKKILYMDPTNLFGHSMSQPLPYDEIGMWHGHPDLYMKKLEEILETSNDSDFGYFLEVDLGYPGNIKEKTKIFPNCPENKIYPKDKCKEDKKKIKTKNCAKAKKLICGWTNKKNYLFHFRMVNFFVRHVLIEDKIHEKNIRFNARKRNKAKNDFEKDFYKLLNDVFYGKWLENVRSLLRLEFIEKDEFKKIIKQQSKLTFNGLHNLYENCDSYTFKQNENFLDKPHCLGYDVLELSKLLMYGT